MDLGACKMVTLWVLMSFWLFLLPCCGAQVGHCGDGKEDTLQLASTSPQFVETQSHDLAQAGHGLSLSPESEDQGFCFSREAEIQTFRKCPNFKTLSELTKTYTWTRFSLCYLCGWKTFLTSWLCLFGQKTKANLGITMKWHKGNNGRFT